MRRLATRPVAHVAGQPPNGIKLGNNETVGYQPEASDSDRGSSVLRNEPEQLESGRRGEKANAKQHERVANSSHPPRAFAEAHDLALSRRRAVSELFVAQNERSPDDG